MSNSIEISEKRSEASRINGAKSQGPKTEEGKAKSSRNSLKHGLYSSVNTMLATDDPEQFDGFHRELYERYAPTDSLQIILVEKIVAALWRKRTFEDIVTGMLLVKGETFGSVEKQFVRNVREIDIAIRIMRNLDRTADAAERKLIALQSDKSQERTQALDPETAREVVPQMLELRKDDLDDRNQPDRCPKAEPSPGVDEDDLLSFALTEAMNNPESELGSLLNRAVAKYPNLPPPSDTFEILDALYEDEELVEELKSLIY